MSEFKVKKDFPDMPQIDGVSLASIDSGISKSKKLDLMLVKGSPGSVICGLLTKSKTCSPAVKWCRKNLSLKQDNTKPIGIVANSGNANVFTGKVGEEAVHSIITAAKTGLGTKKENIFVASTGVIGEKFPIQQIKNSTPQLVEKLRDKQNKFVWFKAASSIMTTDTRPKLAFEECRIWNKDIRLSAIAKGSGMISPNMATMLAFVFTDADIPSIFLKSLLKRAMSNTFNAITVDSDTSTNDMVAIFSSNKVKTGKIYNVLDPKLKDFEMALQRLLLNLAKQIVSDGEGAKKFITVKVTNARSQQMAKNIAFSIANSPLFKTAMAGEDPNWGRIIMAIGKSGEKISPDKIEIKFGELKVAEKGKISEEYNEERLKEYMKWDDLLIEVNLKIGQGSFECYTCDLTNEYININADYRN